MRYQIIISFIFLFFSGVTYSQSSFISFSHNFDGIEYSQDSSIKRVYQIRNGIKNGYSIEFNRKGNPINIGRYVNSNKYGLWLTSTGQFTTYDFIGNGGGLLIPGCGTGVSDMKEKFNNLFLKLISQKIYRL